LPENTRTVDHNSQKTSRHIHRPSSINGDQNPNVRIKIVIWTFTHCSNC